MSKHTPGPWWSHLGDPNAKCNCPYIFSAAQNGMGCIATVHYDGDGTHGAYGHEYEPREVAEANARLIAAAPDLLAAVERFLEADKDREFADTVDLDEYAMQWANALNGLKAAVAKARGES